MATIKTYLKRFFDEKQLDNKQFEITDTNGTLHVFDNDTLIERILSTSSREQNQIATVLRKIDFKNGSVQHYLNFLAECMVMRLNA